MQNEPTEITLARHIQKDADEFAELRKLLIAIDKKLEPIAEAYTSVSNLGKWGMRILIFISIVVGIFVSLRK